MFAYFLESMKNLELILSFPTPLPWDSSDYFYVSNVKDVVSY